MTEFTTKTFAEAHYTAHNLVHLLTDLSGDGRLFCVEVGITNWGMSKPIDSIKAFRQIFGLGLRDSKNLYEAAKVRARRIIIDGERLKRLCFYMSLNGYTHEDDQPLFYCDAIMFASAKTEEQEPEFIDLTQPEMALGDVLAKAANG